jgi:hypothetical protein
MMAASPEWKVYRNKEYIGCCKYAEDAAALVALGGGVIKHGHSMVVWIEGQEDFSAGESYDGAARVMDGRVRKAVIAHMVKVNGAEYAMRCGATAEEVAAA